MRPLTHTFAFRAEVLSRIDSGESIPAVAKATGVPKNTIYSWTNALGRKEIEIGLKKEAAKAVTKVTEMVAEAKTAPKAWRFSEPLAPRTKEGRSEVDRLRWEIVLLKKRLEAYEEFYGI